VTERCKGANKQESSLLYFSLHFSTAFISNKILSVDHCRVAFAWAKFRSRTPPSGAYKSISNRIWPKAKIGMSTNGTAGVHSTSTPPPTSAIDWDQVGFKVHKVNGHAQATWTDGKWGNPEFQTDEYLHIHGFASCLNYGQVRLFTLVGWC